MRGATDRHVPCLENAKKVQRHCSCNAVLGPFIPEVLPAEFEQGQEQKHMLHTMPMSDWEHFRQRC